MGPSESTIQASRSDGVEASNWYGISCSIGVITQLKAYSLITTLNSAVVVIFVFVVCPAVEPGSDRYFFCIFVKYL